MEKIDRNIKILIGTVIVFAIGMTILEINTQAEIKKIISTTRGELGYQLRTEIPIEEKATLIIDDKTGNPQRFEIKVNKETTVFDLLKQTKISLDYTEYDTGIFINAIGEIRNNKKEGKYWMYYVNGERAESGVGEQIVNPGNKVEFRFEKVGW